MIFWSFVIAGVLIKRRGRALAFLSPRIIAAIINGTAPADHTVTGIAKALPYSGIEQEQRIGL